MTSSLTRCLSLSKHLRASPSATSQSSTKCFSTSSPRYKRKKPRDPVDVQGRRTVSLLEDSTNKIMQPFSTPSKIRDAPTAAHIILQNQRQMLHYMRLIEHEMPKLVAYRKEFIPPSGDKPLIMRSVHYQGEVHPVSIKRVIVAPVDQLPLKDEKAIHKFILLAGPRWSPVPHTDAGVSGNDIWGNGYIKISCEDFPKAAQNLKWASDTLDKLIAEANNSEDDFSDVPLDLRHLYAKVRKAKKGDHRGNTPFSRTTIHDFPSEWLPRIFQ